MGILTFLIPATAAFLSRSGEHPFLFWSSVLVSIVAFVSWRILMVAAYSAAEARRVELLENMRFEGRSELEIARVKALPVEITPSLATSTPDLPAQINLVATCAGVLLLLWTLVVT